MVVLNGDSQTTGVVISAKTELMVKLINNQSTTVSENSRRNSLLDTYPQSSTCVSTNVVSYLHRCRETRLCQEAVRSFTVDAVFFLLRSLYTDDLAG